VQWLARGRRIFLLVVPLAVIHVGLRGRFPPTNALVGDWWNLTHYFVVFVFGLVCLGRPAFTEACERNRHLALVLFLLVAPARAWVGMTAGPVQPYSSLYVALLLARAVTEWSALVAVIGYASRHLSTPRRWLAWAGDRVYPFYIWHQTVIVAIAFWVVQWTAGSIVKFVIVTAVSLVLTLAVCELVRLTPITRLLFGIKSRAASARA
jgi:peptidoglycan/LPS O-acetylase OafA/YrhL